MTAPPRLRGRTMGVLGATSAMASGRWRAARRRARRRAGVAHGNPGLRGDGAGRRRRVLPVLSRHSGARPRRRLRPACHRCWACQCVSHARGLAACARGRPRRLRPIHRHVFRAERRRLRLRSRRRRRRRHHQHGVHRGNRFESRRRHARRSLQQALRAGRNGCDRSGGIGVVGEHEVLFRVATAVVIGFGFSAANQLYGLAGSLLPRRETGNAMGIVSLGAGLFGYSARRCSASSATRPARSPQGSTWWPWHISLTLGLIVLLYRLTRRPT